ncbi:alginate lyase family protein [bacterium]|nr:alginate lyase family protein [bacterium]
MDPLPRVFLVSPKSLAIVKLKPPAAALARLRRDADAALQQKPVSVMDKNIVPPSGDKHDYMSVGPYWWPDPKKKDGLPYIRKDGVVNPERHNYDNVGMGQMSKAVSALALGRYFTGDERYAEHAVVLLRTWFLDPATRMSPHLEYGQAIPGRCTGRCIGIIDTLGLPHVVDAVGLLAGSEAWTEGDQRGMVEWFRRYLDWLLTSKHGQAEARTRNNHGTWCDVQVASFALFVGRDDVAGDVLRKAATLRIAAHIDPDGRQPHELARTKSWDYSAMNLRGLFALAALGERAGVNLWTYESPDGRSLRKALDYLVPFALGERKWPHKQIKTLRPASVASLLRRGAIAWHEPRYEVLLARIPGVSDDDRMNLLTPKP